MAIFHVFRDETLTPGPHTIVHVRRLVHVTDNEEEAINKASQFLGTAYVVEVAERRARTYRMRQTSPYQPRKLPR